MEAADGPVPVFCTVSVTENVPPGGQERRRRARPHRGRHQVRDGIDLRVFVKRISPPFSDAARMRKVLGPGVVGRKYQVAYRLVSGEKYQGHGSERGGEAHVHAVEAGRHDVIGVTPGGCVIRSTETADAT